MFPTAALMPCEVFSSTWQSVFFFLLDPTSSTKSKLWATALMKCQFILINYFISRKLLIMQNYLPIFLPLLLTFSHFFPILIRFRVSAARSLSLSDTSVTFLCLTDSRFPRGSSPKTTFQMRSEPPAMETPPQ